MPITNGEKSFPSVHIEKIQDLSLVPKANEKGIVTGVAVLDYGNPKNAIIINSNPLKPLTTKIVDGGVATNEQAHILDDFFNISNTKMILARRLGATSKIFPIEVKDTSGVLTLVKGTTGVNIWGASNVDVWGDVAKSKAFEILLKIAPKKELKFH